MEEKQSLIVQLIKMANADEKLRDEEYTFMTTIAGFMGVSEFEMAYLFGESRRRDHAQRCQARASKTDSGDLEKLPTVEIHRALLIR